MAQLPRTMKWFTLATTLATTLVTTLGLTACSPQDQPLRASTEANAAGETAAEEATAPSAESTGDSDASTSVPSQKPSAEGQLNGETLNVSIPAGWEKEPGVYAGAEYLTDALEAFQYLDPASQSKYKANLVLTVHENTFDSVEDYIDAFIRTSEMAGQQATVEPLPPVEIDGFEVGGWLVETDWGEFETDMMQHKYVLISDSGLLIEVVFSATPEEFVNRLDIFDEFLMSVSLS